MDESDTRSGRRVSWPSRLAAGNNGGAAGGMDVSDEAGAGQYHFDPATYLTMMLAEFPAYRDLQHHVAAATTGINAGYILDLGWEQEKRHRRRSRCVPLPASSGVLRNSPRSP